MKKVKGVLPVVALVNLGDAQASAIINDGELPVAAPLALNGLEELGVDLKTVTRQWLLITTPALFVWFEALILRQAIQATSRQDAKYSALGSRMSW